MSMSSIHHKYTLVYILVLLVFTACSGDGYHDDDHFFDDPGVAECSLIGQNRFVFDVMDQWYLWNNTLPDINPDNYNSPEALLDALVVNAPVVDRFSYIADQESSDAFFNQGEFTGLGFTSQIIDGRLFLALVFPGSPAENSGMGRGFEILAVDGIDVATTLANGNSVDFGSGEIGTAVDIEFADLNGDVFVTTVIKTTVHIDPVPASNIIDNNGVVTGYLHLYTFIDPSFTALDATINDFNANGVEDVIIDLRYNSGGLVSVAEHLAGLLGGNTTSGEIMYSQFFNAERAAENDVSVSFSNPSNALDLQRVVFITDSGSASASELVINSLSPFLNVVIVGDTTFGKPVGQFGFNFCGNTLFPVSFETVNANGEGEYYDGLLADCPAGDDLSLQLGNPDEASLAEALTYLSSGDCTPAAMNSKQSKTTLSNHTSIEMIQNWKPFNVH
ncbi:MAG: peptidase [Gammaproteobacteria bacterium]|nr:peptidase [Gammaproteobacteria bacterium]NNC97411.1 peptidase [Gammaproteobacteria bacterium]NNM13646.1 peptidase [Gammaproteobacteria bacterium]